MPPVDILPADVERELASGAYDPPMREKICVLLIDANARDCLALTDIAGRSKQLEIQVTSCRSPAEAEILAAQRRFDAVLLEYWFGAETSVAYVHATASAGGPPCIVVTAFDAPDIRRLAFRAGARGFLSKDSLSPQALESVALAVLGPRLNPAQAAA
jgi:DNA-binding NarL/FixJ family response regulator